MEDTLLPPGIARNMSQRSKESVSSLGSYDFDYGVGNGEKVGFERKYENQFARRDIGGENGNGNIEGRGELGEGESFGGQGYGGVGDC
jgi:hypothetical protein